MAQGIKYEPTDDSRRLVTDLASVGIRYEDIAAKLQISSDTLVKYYKKELDDGRVDANADIGRSLYNQAREGNTQAMIFWLKTRAGWAETQKVEHSGVDGQPIDLNIKVNFVKP